MPPKKVVLFDAASLQCKDLGTGIVKAPIGPDGSMLPIRVRKDETREEAVDRYLSDRERDAAALVGSTGEPTAPSAPRSSAVPRALHGISSANVAADELRTVEERWGPRGKTHTPPLDALGRLVGGTGAVGTAPKWLDLSDRTRLGKGLTPRLGLSSWPAMYLHR